MVRGRLKMTRNLTTACTRPRTRRLSCSSITWARRVMPGIRSLHGYAEKMRGERMQVRVNRFHTMSINLLILPFSLFLFISSQITTQTTHTYEGQQIEIGLKPDKDT